MARLIIFALLSLCFANEAKAGCADQLSLRNQTWSQRGPARFESRNGEFSFVLPFKKQQIEWGSFRQRCFFAHNIDSLGEPGHFSLEWVILDDALSDEDFVKYWERNLSGYLVRNFGDGKYELIEKRVYVDSNGRKSIAFAASGTHNGGEPGSIIGITSNFKVRMATTYELLPTVLENAAPVAAVFYAPVTSLSESVRCNESTCGK